MLYKGYEQKRWPEAERERESDADVRCSQNPERERDRLSTTDDEDRLIPISAAYYMYS